MNKLPKLSVVTITYGHQDYITEMLDGVFMQQYDGPVEFIIANDNSPDNTDQVIKDYLAKHTIPDNFEVKYTKHPQNIGMMPNFFWALDQATGKYLSLCEGDDVWIDRLKLQKQVEFLEFNHDFSLVFSNAEVLINKDSGRNNSERGLKVIEENREYLPAEIVKSWLIPTASVVLRTSALGNFYYDKVVGNKNFMFGDTVLFLCAAKYGKLYGMQEYFVKYRRHVGGATNTKASIEADQIFGDYYLEIIKLFGSEFKNALAGHIGRVYFSQALYALKNKNIIRFSYCLFYTCKYQPKLVLNYIRKKLR